MKRLVDFWMALLLLLVLAVPLAVIAVLLTAAQGSPVLFRQERVGRHGRPFHILKFRTMRTPRDGDSPVTSGQGDPRVTPFGAFLRAHRLDEFPQLWNVLMGHMSLVGPRPEVPHFVDLTDPTWARVLSVRPGITGPDALQFRDEGAALEAAENPETHYRETLLPAKLRIQADYALNRSMMGDVRILFRTLGALRG